ncbi:MAG: DUF222 domain-containing protein [Ornithinimicrobium sp.]
MEGTWSDRLAETINVLTDLVGQAQRSTVGLASGALLADVAELQRAISAASAAQTLRLAQFAARDEARDEYGAFVEVDHGVGHVADFRTDDAATVLALPPSMAQRRVHTAARLASVLPATLRLVADGGLDPFRAQIVAEETLLASATTCQLVEEQIYPVLPEMTPGAFRRRVRRAVAAVDPEAVKADAARSRQQLFVSVRGCDVPGVSEWFARLNTEDSVLSWAAIDAAGHQAKAENPTRSIDQCRAEALADLILGRAEVTTSVVIPVPIFRDLTSAPSAPTPSSPTTAGSAASIFQRFASGVEVMESGSFRRR